MSVVFPSASLSSFVGSNIILPTQPLMIPSDAKEINEERKKFRLQSKNLVLTWPKCYTSREQVREKCELHFAGNIRGYAIAQEAHKDGTPHIHVSMMLKERIDTKYENELDVLAGQHGNYQSARSLKKWTNYVLKSDVNAIKFGDILDDETWTTILQSSTVKEMWENLVKNKPRDAAINGKRIVENYHYHKGLKRKRQEKPEKKLLPFKITIPMERWVIDNVHRPNLFERTRCLVVHGGPNLGKTEWARSLFPKENVCYLQGIFNLKKLEEIEDLKLIIFDDIEWHDLPQKKMLLQAKGETELTDKYMKKCTVHIHAPAIYLTNKDDFMSDVEFNSYWKSELDVVYITSRLY
nr:putative replication associated protein [Crucivirus sp.]